MLKKSLLTLTALGSLPLMANALYAAKDPVLANVNGKAIKQSEVAKRLWTAAGPDALQQMVDDELLRQEARAIKLTPDVTEVELRMSRIRQQLGGDENTLEARLKSSGTSLKDLKSQIEFQVLKENLVQKAKGLAVADEEVKAIFEANKDKLGSPETYQLRHILVQTEAEARSLATALKAGADFAKLAQELSLDASSKERGGDLGMIPRSLLAPEIEKVVTGLEAGQVGPVIQTAQGFHLIQVVDKRASQPANFDQVKETLRQAILGEKINRSYPAYMQELRAKSKISLEPAKAAF